ncbi:GMC family oxidoreductase N-terminal domain-containing protein [Rhizobiaceae bacterium]|nr:GMC family oxidoreductase N-terminal domain-containing protein [Rhizobiaceae bacterium]
MAQSNPTFDYVIVGAGSAGCVLANRLTANGRHTVLLLEAGGSDRWSLAAPWIHLPIGYGRTFTNPAVNWMYHTAPQQGLGGRELHWPRGKVLGGSSSINAMVHIRGCPQDYDGWAADGATGWGWSDVKPFFERAEADTGGPLALSSRWEDMHPLSRRFVRAAGEAGLPERSDFNTDDPEGAGHYRTTQTRSMRMSAARAYLHPARKRPNLTVVTRAQTRRILFEGTRAIGVEYVRNGKAQIASAGREVILATGAVATPQLLQLSGIGPAGLMADNGIAAVLANENVGAHLQDHLCIDAIFATTVPTLNDQLRPLHRQALHALNYALRQRGPLSLGINQAGGFRRSRPDATHVDQQLYFAPISYDIARHAASPKLKPDPHSAMLIGVQPCRPTSRGTIRIVSSDPDVRPIIDPNYLSTEQDVAEMVEAARVIRLLAATPLMQAVTKAELRPGPDVQSDADLEAYVRRWCGTVYHPVGTARMGSDPSSSAVDPSLRVHGIAGLRVVDASVFPAIPSGNTNAPTIMVAEKAAQLILDAG